MIAVFLRTVLLLLPLVAVLMWLRWRLRTDRTEEELADELAKMRKVLALLIIVAIGAGIGLKLTDGGTGDVRSIYIPPHTENGKVVPGRFVPADEAPSKKTPPDDEPGPESDEEREQNPG